MPQNFVSKRPYRGINLLLLASMDFGSPYFLTFNQVQELGGSVKKGERSTPVVFWRQIEETVPGSEEKKKKYVLRYYVVFNLDQCEGIPKDKIPFEVERDNDPILECEAIVQGYPNAPKIVHKAQHAFYSPTEDKINMPRQKSFIDSESYYSTLFHELVHSTGHTKRLNRDEVMKNNGMMEPYSQEELVAEIGACSLMSMSGVKEIHFEDTVSYIQCWIEKLKNDTRFIVFASAKAQKAVDYILNVTHEEIPDAVTTDEEATATAGTVLPE